MKLISFGKVSLNVEGMFYYIQSISKFVVLVSIAHTQLVMSKLQAVAMNILLPLAQALILMH